MNGYIVQSEPPIFKSLLSLADGARFRLLHILSRHELSVSELCVVLELPQSTVSRHLKLLIDEGWLTARHEGTSHYYRMNPSELPESLRSLWILLEDEMVDATAEDESRVARVLQRRRRLSQEFFASRSHWTVEQWRQFRTDLFGDLFHLHAMLHLLDEGWCVADLGCGPGAVAESLAPHVRRVIAVDGSEEMLDVARDRMKGHTNVEFRRGELDALPIDDEELEAAVMMLVLHYLPDPLLVLKDARRSLRPGGKLLVVDMLPHEREDYRRMGHVWLGFSPSQIQSYFEDAGLEDVRITRLPSDPASKGPGLFAATARNPFRDGGARRDAFPSLITQPEELS